MTMSRVVLNEASCYHSPPAKVLDIAVVGTVVFLSICDNSEDHDTTTTVIREEIMVDVNTLYNSLKLLAGHNEGADRRRSMVEERNCCKGEVDGNAS